MCLDFLKFFKLPKFHPTTFIGMKQLQNGEVELYRVWCKVPDHGWFEDYPHGYSNYFLCPKCLEAEKVVKKYLD